MKITCMCLKILVKSRELGTMPGPLPGELRSSSLSPMCARPAAVVMKCECGGNSRKLVSSICHRCFSGYRFSQPHFTDQCSFPGWRTWVSPFCEPRRLTFLIALDYPGTRPSFRTLPSCCQHCQSPPYTSSSDIFHKTPDSLPGRKDSLLWSHIFALGSRHVVGLYILSFHIRASWTSIYSSSF